MLAPDILAEAPDAVPAAQSRRTFAIISHPDAGKTTLTEKLLLFGGAIQLAGEVKAKRNRVSTRSDWMGIEKERGISVVTSVMTFEYSDRVERRSRLALTCPARLMAPPNSRSFSVNVVLPASGCEMIAKVRRRSISAASGDSFS